MPMPTTSAAAAANHGTLDAPRPVPEIGTATPKCEASITLHISSRGGLGGTLNVRGKSRIASSNRSSSIILLLECSELFPQLRSCGGELALGRPFGDTQHAGDYRVGMSLNDPGDELSFVHAVMLFAVATMVAI